ncbi:hypothetical protein EDB92DRAFT_508475 [Lactarius akahatsu]|uniref:Uncharacterized protein n=1 Tax=Lactarius akahatsu TaxID=416441 RepID=A0AAD4LUQ8_9AGAM|nr:hypothetical protein EDB92DRAFT_508475 [Lactarius akahatsu]
MQPNVLIPDLAAPACGLRNSSSTPRQPRSLSLRGFMSRGGVHDCLRSPVTTRPSRAQCSPVPTVPFPDRAVLVRSLSYSTQTRLRPLRAYLQHLAPRGGLRAHLRRFTPPKSCAPLTLGCLAHFEHFSHRADPLSETIYTVYSTQWWRHHEYISRPRTVCHDVTSHGHQHHPGDHHDAGILFSLPCVKDLRLRPFCVSCNFMLSLLLQIIYASPWVNVHYSLHPQHRVLDRVNVPNLESEGACMSCQHFLAAHWIWMGPSLGPSCPCHIIRTPVHNLD